MNTHQSSAPIHAPQPGSRDFSISRFFAYIAVGAVYALGLSWLYLSEISWHWEYAGFSADGGIRGGLLSVTAAALLMALLPKQRDLRSFMLALLGFFFFIPSIVLYFLRGAPNQYLLCLTASFVLVIIFSSLRGPTFNLTRLSLQKLLIYILVVNVGVVIFYIALGGLRNFNLRLADVYEFRRESASELPGWFGFIYSNVSKVLLPAAIVIALALRSWLALVLTLFCVVLLFGMTHHKSVLFIPLLVAGLYYFARRGLTIWMASLIPLGVVMVAGLEHLYIVFLSSADVPGTISSYLVRRGLFVPALLDMLYVDFFQDASKYYWSTSRFGLGLFGNPYAVTPPFLIGEYMFGSEEMSANTGVIGSGYSHAGLAGVVFYAVLTGLVISHLNAVGSFAGHALVGSISVPVVLAIVRSTDFTTAVLTHGLLALLLLLSLLPRSQSGNDHK